jgi:N-terminal domain of NWD NACHT-NTPase
MSKNELPTQSRIRNLFHRHQSSRQTSPSRSNQSGNRPHEASAGAGSLAIPAISPLPQTTATTQAGASRSPYGPDRLWDQAYDDLKKTESRLLELYEAILSCKLKDAKNGKNLIEQDLSKRDVQMDDLVKIGLKQTEKLGKAKKDVGIAIDIVLSVKDAIGGALQPVPIAALAWTGVCVALQVRSWYFSSFCFVYIVLFVYVTKFSLCCYFESHWQFLQIPREMGGNE